MKKENGKKEEEEKEEDWKILKKGWRWRWRRWRCWWRQETGGGWRRWQIQNEHQLIPIFKKFFFLYFFLQSLGVSCSYFSPVPLVFTCLFSRFLFSRPWFSAYLFVCLFENILSKIKWEKNLHIGNSVTAAWPLWISVIPKVLSMSHLPEPSWEQSL